MWAADSDEAKSEMACALLEKIPMLITPYHIQ